MRDLRESILDDNLDIQGMPSTNFPGADELLSILEKYDWKSRGNSDKDGIKTYTYYGIVHKYTNKTFYADLKDWIYKFGRKSKSGLYNLGTFVPDNHYVRSKRTGNESTIKINLFDLRSILAINKWGEEELSVQQRLSWTKPTPKGKYNFYIHELAGGFIEWFVKNESSK